MAIGDESASLLFRIKGDSANARAALKQFRDAAESESTGAAAKMREAFKGVESAVTALIGSMGRIPRSASAIQSSLSATSAAVADQLKKAQSLGQTGAVTARSYEKLNEKITQSQRALQAASAAFARGEISAKQFQQVLASTERTVAGVNSRLADSGARLTDFAAKQKDLSGALSSIGSSLASLGAGIRNLGVGLTASVTAPITALATLGVRSALELDKARTKLTALEGDSVKAAARMAQLFALADSSVGVTRAAALETFSQLKGIGGIAEETINGLIGTIGRLNAAFDLEDQQGFIRNLVQIFTQGFERADIKEAIGRVPIFEQLIEQAFGTKDADKLKQLQASGKLTLDAWMQGLIGAVNSDTRLAGISESLTVKFAKGFERINQALAPLGDIILSVIVPIFESLAPYIQLLSDYFKSLSPTVQKVVVAFGAFAAALGPVLIVIGSVIAAIAGVVGGIASAAIAVGGFVALAKIAGIAILALIGLFIQLAPVIVTVGTVIATLYTVWTRNFGGIQEFTFAAWERIKEIIKTATEFITATVGAAVNSLVTFWRDNYAQIEAAVNVVSENIKGVLRAFFAAVEGFWQTHGERISAVARQYWDGIAAFVSRAVEQLGNFIRLGLAIINGDWNKAWNEFLKIIRLAVQNVVATVKNGVELWGRFLFAAIPVVVEFGIKFQLTLVQYIGKAIAAAVVIFATLPQRLLAILPQLVPALISAGNQIGAAILEGVRQALDTSAKAAVSGAFPDAVDIPVVQAGISGDLQKTVDERKQSAGARQKERDRAYREELQAQSRQNQILLERERETFKEIQEEWEQAFIERRKTEEEFHAASENNIETYWQRVRQLLFEQFKRDRTGQTGTALKNITLEYENAVKAINRTVAEERAGVEKTITDTVKKESDKRVKISEDEAARKIRTIERESDAIIFNDEQAAKRGEITNVEAATRASVTRLAALEKEKQALQSIIITEENRVDVTERLAVLDDRITRQRVENEELYLDAIERDAEAEQIIIDRLTKRIEKEEELERIRRERLTGTEGDLSLPAPVIEPPDAGLFDTFFDTFADGVAEYLRNIALVEDANGNLQFSFTQVFKSMADVGLQALGQLASGFGNLVSNFVLYGSAGEDAIRKLLAQVAASVAGTAATYAAMCFAAAILASTGFGAILTQGTPAQFVAAGLAFAALAGGAALIGRGIAGDTFNRSAQSSFNQQTARATGGQSGSSAGGNIYTPNEQKQVIDINRNQSQQQEPVLVVVQNKSSFGELLKIEIQRNGLFRDELKRLVNG